MPLLILMLYFLGETWVLLPLGIITFLSICAFLYLEEHLRIVWSKEQQLPEGIAKITMRAGAVSFLLILLFLAGLIIMAVRDNFYSEAENIAIVFSSGTAFAYIYLLIRAKKWVMNKRDSKPCV